MSNFSEDMFDGLFFDWYQGTLGNGLFYFDESKVYHGLNPVDHQSVINRFLDAFPASYVQPASPRAKQYHHGIDILSGGRKIVHLCWGGNGGGVHFLASGSVSHDVAAFLQRDYGGQYGISRVDVRADMVDPSAWEYLYGVAFGFAAEARHTKGMRPIKTSNMGDWDTGEGGRTYYLGSKSSAVQVRIYEKGKKEGGDPDWVRFEAQIRPPKAHDKRNSAMSTPIILLGSKPWLASLCSRIFRDNSMPCHLQYKSVWTQDKDLDRRRISLCRQYGRTLKEILDLCNGDVQAFGVALVQGIEDFEREDGVKCGFGESPYREINLDGVELPGLDDKYYDLADYPVGEDAYDRGRRLQAKMKAVNNA